MSNFVRRLVSGNKARFKDKQLDLELDLVYVTDHIVIMGYPAAGVESFYRNSRKDAKRFLEHHHGKNYWVFNFCPLRENSYDSSVFDGRVSRYPFPDHHAPPLAILPLVSREIQQWLSGSTERVAVLHCKAGKGRSGTLACAYLLSLDVKPSPPKLKRSLTTKELRKIRTDMLIESVESVAEGEGIDVEEGDDTLSSGNADGTNNGLSGNIQPNTIQNGDRITVENPGLVENPQKTTSSTLNSSILAAPKPQSGDARVEFSSQIPHARTHTLKDILSLHTSRRMRTPSSPDKKISQGVSIPSQRRWLHYWSQLLANAGPSGFWNLTSPATLKKPSSTDPDSARLTVRLTRVTIRMRQLSAVTKQLVKLASKAIETTTGPKGTSSQGDTPVEATKSPEGQEKGKGPVWVSLSRYDDKFVRTLERWEKWTRDENENLGAMKRGSGTMPPTTKLVDDSEMRDNPEGVEEELRNLFKDGKWDSEKMVKSFARMGDVEGKKSKEITKEGVVVSYTLHPLSFRSWEAVRAKIEDTNEQPDSKTAPAPAIAVATPLKSAPPEVSNSLLPNPDCTLSPPRQGDGEASAVSSTTSLGVTSRRSGSQNETPDGIVLDAEREVKLKLYMGRVFMGWIWFIPTFHLPHPTTSGDQEILQKRHTITFTKKEIDFAIGAGSALVDVTVEMEWVR